MDSSEPLVPSEAVRTLGCVTGRFQPVHPQHMELFEIVLESCDHLVVAVTNPDAGARHQEAASAHRHTAEANPFTYYERARLIGAAVAAEGLVERVTVVPFDLVRRDHWAHYVPMAARQYVRTYSEWERQKAQWLADAGYAVTVLTGDPGAKQSSTTVRERLTSGEGWQELVPSATVPLLDELLAHTSMAQRAAQ
jgi:cytidyltransferase-like protein